MNYRQLLLTTLLAVGAAGAYASPDMMMTAARQQTARGAEKRAGQNALTRQAQQARAAALLGEVYGACNYFKGYDDTYTQAAKCFFGRIDFSGKENTPIYTGIEYCNTLDQDHQTGAIRNGILYIPQGNRSDVADADIEWKRINLKTGAVLPSIQCGDKMSMWAQAMCYDPVTDKFYIMTINEDSATNSANRIAVVTINDDDLSYTIETLYDYPAQNGSYVAGLTYNPADKEIYVIRDNGTLMTLNRKDGSLMTVAELECVDPVDEASVMAGYTIGGTTQFVFSPRDNAFILLTRNWNNFGDGTNIYTIDPETGEVTYIGELYNQQRFTALTCADPYAPTKAAGTVAVKEIKLTGAELTGSVTITAPTALYDGGKLSGDVEVTAAIDGKTIFTGKMAPGESKEVSFTTTEGLHKLSTRADVSEKLKGPEAVTEFYAGNDEPLAPTGLEINGTTLTWKAPGAKGVNNGFVDVDALTYNVFFNGQRQNRQPLTEPSYTYTNSGSLSLKQMQVIAIANGKNSARSEALSALVGNPLSLPYEATPTSAQAQLFTVIDANHDGSKFIFDSQNNAFNLTYENYQSSDDWLILPLIQFNDASKMYDLDLTFTNSTAYYGTENLEFYIGKDSDIASMTRLDPVFTSLKASASKALRLNVRFGVPEAGKYNLAVRANTKENGSGAIFTKISVKDAGVTTAVPAKISDLKIEAGEKGALSGVASFTAPVNDQTGKPLAADKKLTFTVTAFENEANTASAQALPGEKVTITCPADNGFNTFHVTAANEAGHGIITGGRTYCGIDIPEPVTNFYHVTSEDNLTMDLYWDPATTGVNGGYIDPENLKYGIWYNPSGVTWNRVGQPIAETKTTFNPQTTELARWKLTVLPENSAGFKKVYSVNYQEESLGVPHTLPIIEPFAYEGPIYKWNYVRSTPETENSSIRFVLNDELAVLRIGNPRTDDGCARIVSSLTYGQPVEAELIVPKFSTVGLSRPTLTFDLWNYAKAPRVQILARCFEVQNAEPIADFEIDENNLEQWRQIEVELPEKFRGKQWVELRIHFYIPGGESAYGVYDNISIFENVDTDFKVKELTADNYAYVGDVTNFNIVTENAGRERGSANMTVSLLGDDKLLEKREYDFWLAPHTSEEKVVSFRAIPDYLNYKNLVVRAEVAIKGDEVDNNNMLEMPWYVSRPALPVISDLKASRNDDNSVALAWSKPDLTFGNLDNVEMIGAFEYGEKLGQWKNVDVDKLEPYIIDGLQTNWVDVNKPKGWQVINDISLGTANDARLGAHSGHQYFLAMSGFDPENENKQFMTSDWLISPEVAPGTKVSFWINTPNPDQQETMEIRYSTTDDKPESFYDANHKLGDNDKADKNLIRKVSKVGQEAWEKVEITLPENAKYFAFVYTGWDSMGYLLDDIDFSPVKLEQLDLESFNVYVCDDGSDEYVFVATTPETSYSHTKAGHADLTYYVTANVGLNGIRTEGPASNIASVGATSVKEIDTLGGVYSGHGFIAFKGYDGSQAAIYDTAGKLVRLAELSGETARVEIEAGIYIVKIGTKYAKVIVM